MSSIARIANKVFKNFQKLKASGPALIGPTRALKAAPSPAFWSAISTNPGSATV